MKTGVEILFEDRKGVRPNRVFLVAGEASGDEHAALLIEALLKIAPHTDVFGMGGSALRARGMETVVDAEVAASVMGLTEVLGSLRRIFSARERLIEELDRRRPDVAVLVDFPDFNLRLAELLARRKIPVVYFISPQLWAWRSGRVRAMQRCVREVIAIFPFEEEFYARHGVKATFVGHPFADRPPLTQDRESFFSALGLDPSALTVGLLPGSRKAEIRRLLPPMAGALKVLRDEFPALQAVLPLAPALADDLPREILGANVGSIRVVRGMAREVLSSVDAAIVASGTATVEAAIAGAPSVVVYKLSLLSYGIARLLVRGVKNFAMANLIAGHEVYPELLQGEVRAERIAGAILPLLQSRERREAVRRDLSLVRHRLQLENGGSAAERAAAIIKEYFPRCS